MGPYTVLICDDNKTVHDSLTSYLKAEGFEVLSALDGESAIEILNRRPVDVMVLDLMMPGMDGYDVCRRIHEKNNVYIIMLSAKSEEYDRIIGLELGADDFVTKPFSPREMVIRIKKAVKRLYSIQEMKRLTLAELTIFPESYQVFVRDKEIEMTAKEIDVLALLVSMPGKVLTRERIINVVWGYGYYGDTRAVDTIVKRLRQKLTCEHVHFLIRTIYSVGYKVEEIK